MEYTAGNVYKAIDMLAPFGGCMAWDNVGLLVGEPDSAVTGILVTLDVTPAAVAQALEMRMNCIVSHHPIIFHPLKRISARDAAGLCLANGISVISAHTNYDFAPRGVNCALAQMLGLRNIRPFGPEDKEKSWYSIIVFVPKSHAEAVYRTMSEAGAGRQGNYSGCAYMNDGEGRFLPEAGLHPAARALRGAAICAILRLRCYDENSHDQRQPASARLHIHRPARDGAGASGGGG